MTIMNHSKKEDAMLIRKIILTALLFIFFVTFSTVLAGEYGRYAILIFGGQETEITTDEEFVQYEMASTFGVLLDDYEFTNSDIYVHNLSGDKNRTLDYYSYFEDTQICSEEPSNYRPATLPDYQSRYGIRQTFLDINSKIENTDSSMVIILMCGHRGKNPSGTLHYYSFFDTDQIPDYTFASYLKSDLLDRTDHVVNSKTYVVFVTGFCNSYGFWDEASASNDEIRDVCNKLSFAAADDGLTTSDRTDGVPPNSFISFWKDEVEDDSDISFHDAFTDTETEYLDCPDYVDDDPVKECEISQQTSGWDDNFCLFGRELKSVTITGPDELGFKDYGTWYANWDAWPCGTFSYQWWKKLNGHQNWQTLGTDSSETERMWKTGFTLKVRVTRGDFYVEDTHLVLNDQESASKPKGPGEANKELAPEFIKPKKFALYSNYPNPFNPETAIRYQLKEASNVRLEIFDASGRLVRTLVQQNQAVGEHTAVWDGLTETGNQAISGMYVYQLRTGDFVQRKKMLLLR